MRVIWKRPDGFLGASPEDFSVIELEGHSRLWVHRRNKDQYPFQVSGGWEEQNDTVRLNNLVNLLLEADERWLNYLNTAFNNSPKDDRREYYSYLETWLGELGKNLKGDTWETEIVSHALTTTTKRLQKVAESFLAAS